MGTLLRVVPVLLALCLIPLAPTRTATAWDPDGATSVTLPEGVTDIVTDLFPEQSNAGSAFVSDSYSPIWSFRKTATSS